MALHPAKPFLGRSYLLRQGSSFVDNRSFCFCSQSERDGLANQRQYFYPLQGFSCSKPSCFFFQNKLLNKLYNRIFRIQVFP